MYDRHQRGKESEFFIACMLSKLGLNVFMPTGNPRWDMVAEDSTGRYLIQVKSAKETGGEIKVTLRGNGNKSYYSCYDADIIAIHDRVNDKAYYVPISEVSGRSSILLRTKQPKCFTTKLTKFAKDYETFPFRKTRSNSVSSDGDSSNAK